MGYPTNAKPSFDTLWLHPETISSLLPSTCCDCGRQCRLCPGGNREDHVQSTSWKVWRPPNSIQFNVLQQPGTWMRSRIDGTCNNFCSVVIGTANNAHELTIDGSVLQAGISQSNQPIPFHGHSANIEVSVIAQKALHQDPPNSEPFTPRLCGPGQQNQLGMIIINTCYQNS